MQIVDAPEGSGGTGASLGVLFDAEAPVVRQPDGSYRVGIDEGVCLLTPVADEPGAIGAVVVPPGVAEGLLRLIDGEGHSAPVAPGRHGTSRVLVDGVGRHCTTAAGHLRGLGVGTVLDGAYAAEAAELALLEPDDRGVDAVLLLGVGPADPDRGLLWQRHGIPHLAVDLRADRAVVGPLVVPGRSSCLNCHELSRADRDRSWPLAAAQQRGLAGGRSTSARTRPAIALLATALAAVLIVEALDGDLSMAGVSTEFNPTIPELVHRHWPRHPRCPCIGAAGGCVGAVGGRAGAEPHPGTA